MGPVLWLFALLPLAFCLQPDGYCNPPYPSWRAQPDYPLKHLTVIIRHGDRSPVYKCWPNSPDWTCTLRHQERPVQSVGNRLYTRDFVYGKNVNPGNCKEGQLTEVGIKQQLKNGEALRKLYGGFLPADFDPNLVYLRSTDVPRTFLSAEGLLFGLFPPSEGCNDPSITIGTMDYATDNMTPNPQFCPKLNTYENQFHASPAYQKFNQTVLMPLEDQLFKIFDVVPGYQIAVMFDCIEAHLCRDFPLPEGLTQEIYDSVIKINNADYANTAFYNIPGTQYTWSQVAMGSFIGDVINNIESVINNQAVQKMALFSGHDTTVLPFIMAYNAWTEEVWPPYASMIRIEVLQGPSGDLVRMYYNDKLLSIPGCPTSTCPYETFMAISKNIADAAQYCF